ncbi:MAG: hypothetical protein HN509_07030, partial [Halobacteriovoraceae bacterium]|nr:hypothetical protein [Halobacteriovoraceae bacterium]
MNSTWREFTAKLLFLLFISSNSFAFSLLPDEVKDALKYMDLEKYTSTVNSYQQICNVSDANLGVLDQTNYQNICNTMMSTSYCKDIPKEKRVSCEDFSQNEIDVTSWYFVKKCATGLWESIKDLIIFLKAAIIWAVENFDGETLQKRIDTGGEFYNSIVNYLSIEFEKAMETAKGDDCLILGKEKCKKTEAAEAVFSNILTKAFKTIGGLIQKEYIKLGCYEPEERVQRICKAIGDVTMPPAFAIGLIIKGPALLRKTKKITGLFDDAPPNKRVAALKEIADKFPDPKVKKMADNMQIDYVKNNSAKPKHGFGDFHKKPGESLNKALERAKAEGFITAKIENGKVVIPQNFKKINIPEGTNAYAYIQELEQRGYRGLRLTKDGVLEQNIMQGPDFLLPSLHRQLNGDAAEAYAPAIALISNNTSTDELLTLVGDGNSSTKGIHKGWTEVESWR